eukprot:6120659-Pyramimonas_sp.AAC.1
MDLINPISNGLVTGRMPSVSPPFIVTMLSVSPSTPTTAVAYAQRITRSALRVAHEATRADLRTPSLSPPPLCPFGATTWGVTLKARPTDLRGARARRSTQGPMACREGEYTWIRDQWR